MVTGSAGIDEFGVKLARLRRRAARHRRLLGTDPEAWQRWSGTMDEIEDVTDQIVRSPAGDLSDLAVKFRAVLWLIECNDSLLDSSDRRRLRRFGRELGQLAAGTDHRS